MSQKECEKLGLHGAVRKNDKGKWEEVSDQAKVKKIVDNIY